MRNWYYSLRRGIKNLLYWFPVIWKDRVWDHTFLFSIMQHKLESMEYHFRHYAMHTCAEKDADNMKLCIELLKRLEAEDYDLAYSGYEESERMQKQDLEMLFNTLQKYVGNWWD